MNAVVKSLNGIRSWTDAQRAEQAAKLHARKIWLKSTGPRTTQGKSISRLNALTHGGTSRPAKDFMAHFRGYHALLRLCFQKKRELLQIQKNELIALRHAKSRKSRSVSAFSMHAYQNLTYSLPVPPLWTDNYSLW